MYDAVEQSQPNLGDGARPEKLHNAYEYCLLSLLKHQPIAAFWLVTTIYKRNCSAEIIFSRTRRTQLGQGTFRP